MTMARTRLGPAALHALQFSLLMILVGVPSFPTFSVLGTFVVLPVFLVGFRAAYHEGLPADFLRWHQCPTVLVVAPIYFVIGFPWTVYFYIPVFLHPFALFAHELRMLFCLRSDRVLPNSEAPVVDVEARRDPLPSEPQESLEHDTNRAGGPRPAAAPEPQGPDAGGYLDLAAPMRAGEMSEPSASRPGLLTTVARAAGALTTLQKSGRYRGYESVWTALEGEQENRWKASSKKLKNDASTIRKGDVRLVSLKWLMEYSKTGLPLPRRQELPEEAFLDAARLKEIQAKARRGFDPEMLQEQTVRMMTGEAVIDPIIKLISIMLGFYNRRNVDKLLPIIAISYCWLEASHPDKKGRQLQLMCRLSFS